MSGLRIALAGLLAIGLAAGLRADDKKAAGDNKAKIVATWEATTGEPGTLPPGSEIDFGKDGKIKITVTPPGGGEKKMIEGTYTVDGEKVELTAKMGDMERKQSLTIAKLTATELTLKGPDGKTVEFKKKK